MFDRYVLGLVVLGLLWGCNDGSGDGPGSSSSVSVSTAATIQLEVDGTPSAAVTDPAPFRFGAATVPVTKSMVIWNTGNGELAANIEFRYQGIPQETEAAFRLKSVTVAGLPAVVDAGTASDLRLQPASEGGGTIVVEVEFVPPADESLRTASLVISSNTQAEVERSIEVPITMEAGNPVASVTPKFIDFEEVNSGDTPSRQITIANTGTDMLRVTSVLFQGHPDYSLQVGTDTYSSGDEIVFEMPIEIAPSASTVFTVSYSPENKQPAEASIVLYTNDEAQPSGILVEVQANTVGANIELTPQRLQFGGKLVGQPSVLPLSLKSTGTKDLEIYGIEFVNLETGEASSPDYTLLFNTLGGTAPTMDQPVVVPVNQEVVVQVEFVADVVAPLDASNQPIPDLGLIRVSSNAFNAEEFVEVSGVGADSDCPTAVGVIQEGEQVIPQTVLHLFGDGSFASNGAIGAWAWEVQQPAGSASTFIPSDAFPNPTFEANVAGEYVFRLNVTDQAGVSSCVPWEKTVVVVPDEAIHVELLWTTPNDPDETDEGPEAGTDLDLHFVHDAYAASGPDIDGDGAPDPWFDQPFDCFWFNANPNWGSFDPSVDDDPGLDRDDTDGAGPENLNLNIPENTTYRVGVHYWSDHEYGDALATVRIYIYSNLVFEVTDVKLSQSDMWDVATIDWPSGAIQVMQGDHPSGYKITPNYINPNFLQ